MKEFIKNTSIEEIFPEIYENVFKNEFRFHQKRNFHDFW